MSHVKVIQVFDMSIIEVLKWVVAAGVNGIIFSVPPYFIYYLVRSKEFRGWIVTMIEDNDGAPNKADGKDAVLLFFAYLSATITINIGLGWWISGDNIYEVFAATLVATGVFFGLSKIPNRGS